MTEITLSQFFYSVPVFILLASIREPLLGIFGCLGAVILLFIKSTNFVPAGASDSAGNALSNNIDEFSLWSAIGGGLTAALYHLTRALWPALDYKTLNFVRFLLFLVISFFLGIGLVILEAYGYSPF